MQIKYLFFLFLFGDFNISNIFYKIQNLNKWQLASVITHWTYTCLNPGALTEISLSDRGYTGNLYLENLGGEELKTTLYRQVIVCKKYDQKSLHSLGNKTLFLVDYF